MCILIVLRGFHDDHPLVVAGNRDERTDRPASPPSLWVGRRRRVLSPRDRRAGGTWLAVDDRGRLAGLTNIAGAAAPPGAPSRGLLPHLALDQDDLGAAVAAVRAAVGAVPHAAFQLVLADAERLLVARHRDGQLVVQEWAEPVLVVTNEHAPGELRLPGLDAALGRGLPLAARLDRLAGLLVDPGGPGRHAVCKRGDGYGTVSSSLLAVPRRDPLALVWRYAPGPPDAVPYRNYGNLGRRLLPEPDA